MENILNKYKENKNLFQDLEIDCNWILQVIENCVKLYNCQSYTT